MTNFPNFPPFVDLHAERLAVEPMPDLAEVRGQASTRRALEVTAAGGHNIIMLYLFVSL
jgi:predicted ATPase with chaperone activity